MVALPGRGRTVAGAPGDTAAAPHAARAVDDVLGRVEWEIARLLRRADATRSPGGDGTPTTLDRSGYLILNALMVDGPRNVNALADGLGLDGSTVTRQVVSLERAGRVRRTRDPHDGRAVVVEPTETGIDDLRRHRAERAELYGRVLGEWSRLDRALLTELLERLNDDLDVYRRRSR